MDKYTENKQVLEGILGAYFFEALKDHKLDFATKDTAIKDLYDAVAKGMSKALEQLDAFLFKAAQQQGFTSVKTKSRTIVDVLGEFRFKKHIVAEPGIEGARNIDLVGAYTSMPASMRVSPRFCARIAEHVTEESMQKTADFFTEFGAGNLTKKAISDVVRDIADLIREEQNQKVYEMFELGEYQKGRYMAEDVYLEVDSTYVSSQEKDTPSICLRTACFFAGKRIVDGKVERIHPAFFCDTVSFKEFKQLVAQEIFSQFDKKHIKRIHIGFDGEKGYMDWSDVFGDDICVIGYLDPYHLNKYITKAFSKHNSVSYEAKNNVYKLLSLYGGEKTLLYLDELLDYPESILQEYGNPQRIKELATYIRNNQEYIVRDEMKASLGTIESDHMRISKARMASRPCSWSNRGAGSLALINAKKLSGQRIPVRERIEINVRFELDKNTRKPRLICLKEKVKSKGKTEYMYAYQGKLVGEATKCRFLESSTGTHYTGMC